MICLSDLPTGALAHVSSYLAAPSRAFFAVALDCREVDSSSAIAGDSWAALDFGDIEKDLAAKLSDEDIRDVLLSIDAVNNLKSLRLTNCINITGVGLDPLRASSIIEQINLSLVGDHESPKLDPEPPISCAEVLPILDNIITESDFHAFLNRFNHYLSSRADVCLKCSCNLPDIYHALQMDGDQYEYGTQNYICYDCMNKYCYECEDDLFGCYISLCHRCERSYCGHCQTVDYFACCGNSYCVDCIDFRECSNCHENACLDCVPGVRCHNNCCADKTWCNNCVENRGAMSWCGNCHESYCRDCCESDIYAVKFCDVCKDSLCGRCRVKKCKEGGNCCARCYQFSFPALLENKERTQTKNNELENENKEQRNEINELKRKVKDLTGELEEV